MSSQPQSPFFSHTNIFAAAFFAVLLFLLYQAGRLITPFLSAVIWATIIVLVLYPLYTRILALLRGRHNLAAGIMTLFTLILVIGPAVLLFALLTAQVVDLYSTTAEFIQSGRLADLWGRVLSWTLGVSVSHPFLAKLDIQSRIMNGLGDLSTAMAAHLGALIKNILLAVVNLFIMLFVIFFFFRDGKAYADDLTDILPFPKQQKKSIMQKLGNTFSAVLNGLFVVSLFQGIMTGLGFLIFGVPFWVFWGFLAAIAALIPVGGTALIWVPGAVYLYVTGFELNAVLLAAWGVLFVSMPDNFLRPLLIGKKAKLPVFFLFLGILGGIQAYGILGILFGPLVVTLLLAFVEIYREEYAGD
jgi:predicted PurR-regulated permease PerM